MKSIFFLETAWPTKIKFHMELSWDGGTKVCSNGPGHMTNIVTMPTHVYGKNLKKASPPEPKASDLETWYAASGAGVLSSLFK